MKNFIDGMFTLTMLSAFLFVAFWGVTYVGNILPQMEVDEGGFIASIASAMVNDKVEPVAFSYEDFEDPVFDVAKVGSVKVIRTMSSTTGEFVVHSFEDEYYCRTTSFYSFGVDIENIYTGEKGSVEDYLRNCPANQLVNL
ncbi:MAG: hypothetical protein KAR24_02245 [Candidatus Pacebacteria bacterium]|nr:hypothetical protein [Candidatus Paceibacterota bacterium]